MKIKLSDFQEDTPESTATFKPSSHIPTHPNTLAIFEQSSRFAEFQKISNAFQESSRVAELFKTSSLFEESRRVAELFETSGALQQSSRIAELFKTSSLLQESRRIAELFKTSSALQESSHLAELLKGSSAFQQISRAAEMLKGSGGFQESSRVAELFKTSSLFEESRRVAELFETSGALQQSSRIAELFKTSSLLQESRRIAELFKTSSALQESIRIAELLDASRAFQESNNDFTDLRVDADGAISSGNNSITSEQLISAFHEVIEPLERNLDEAIDRIIARIDLLKEPLAQKIIFAFLVILISAVINPVLDYQIKEMINTNTKRSIPKEIKKIASYRFDYTYSLSQLKIVTATKLIVRNKNSVKSEMVGVLHIGAIVEVMDKKRNWCYVSWVDNESGASLQGWVFSRYLTSMR